MSNDHSFLSPSSANAWIDCAQFPHMNQRFPQDDTAESIEGTAAHWVNTEVMSNPSPAIGSLTPEGQIVTDEMIDGARLWVASINDRRRGVMAAGIHIEERVDVPQVHAECFGTPDLWRYDAGAAHLDVFDYKFGHGFVDEWWNPQGILYVLGILNKLAPILSNPELVTVSFTIVQPRCFYGGKPVRTHNYTVREMAPHVAKLKRAAEYAYSSKPMARTGLYCDHCPGRHACDALQKGAHVAASYASDRQPHDLTPAAAGLELRMLENAQGLLDARVDALRQLTTVNIKAGKSVPHYKLEAGRGSTKWNVSDEEVLSIGELLGADLRKKAVITPIQAKKYLDASVISAYSQDIPGGLKLTKQNNNQAAKVFGIVQEDK